VINIIIIIIMEAVCDYKYWICRAIIAAAVDMYRKLMNIQFKGPFLNYWPLRVDEPQSFSRSDITESHFALSVPIFLTSLDVV
jgi:hypothetical protein